jgi:hypothetical protein
MENIASESAIKAYNDVNIIISDTALAYFKKIAGYKTSLGKALTKPGSNEYNPWDKFVDLYLTRTGRIIYKTGQIGRIGVYTDFGIKFDCCRLVCGNVKIDLNFERDEIEFNPTSCMNKLLAKLHEIKK